MLGEHEGRGLTSVPSGYHLSDALKSADEQLGRLVAELEKRGLAQRTLIVATADHGGQKNEFYLGNNRYQSCCAFEDSPSHPDPPYWIQHLNQLGKLKTAYVDTSVKLWLDDRSASSEAALVKGMSDISGMAEVYALRQSGGEFNYVRVFSRLDVQEPGFRAWAERHHAELLATMASDGAPHLVGLLADNFGFGRIGDHGGAQEKVQRIPMIIHVPGEKPATVPKPLRLVDLNSLISELAKLEPPLRIPPAAR